MPASNQTVSLDQAKDWARRLHKAAPGLGRLSSAQAAVAVMLGHVDWHALTRFYQDQDATDPSTAPVSFSEGDWEHQELEMINRMHPGLNATSVEMLAVELDEIDGSPEDIVARARELEYEERMFTADAFTQALQEASVVVRPPSGHRFVRVLDDQGRRHMVLLPFAPQPKSRQSRP